MSKRKAKGSGTIYYRKDRDVYCGQVTVGTDPKTGKPIKKTFYGKKQSDVVRQKKKFEADFEAGTYQAATEYTVATWLDQWLESIKTRLASKSYESYAYIVRVHLKPEFGLIKLEDLDTQMIERFLNRKLSPGDGKKGLSIRTVNYVKQTLSTSLRKAKRQRLINYNPAEDVELPKQRKQSRKDRAFSFEEMQIFITGTRDSRYHYIWDIGFLTGFRRGELLGLQWKDIDFDNCRINLCRQVLLDGNNKPIVTEVLKTEGSSQQVSVMPIVIERLRQCRRKQSEFLLKLGLKIDDNALIFSNYDGRPYRPDVVSHRFTAERKRLGLRDGLSMHSTRHTFATLGTEVGIETPKLMDLMRHSDIKITMGYVDKMKDSSFKVELAKLSKAVESIFDEQTQL